jgi:hypothetical protein
MFNIKVFYKDGTTDYFESCDGVTTTETTVVLHFSGIGESSTPLLPILFMVIGMN